ncbi:hypothetical protein M407DRAFT_171270 [Tulasnella calospora MUT 4182]|uniref:Uncharacterized protein n=1 Tax=Tulasnella calospora MUT 4182 TaxID=1051891 RepID=A0A0C3PS31_9AGAM|nr:hypothetical protein M407DRAFT_171270 [Tulasnella calospora MUT 4182]
MCPSSRRQSPSHRSNQSTGVIFLIAWKSLPCTFFLCPSQVPRPLFVMCILAHQKIVFHCFLPHKYVFMLGVYIR